jgi:ankyrin repeat protein
LPNSEYQDNALTEESWTAAHLAAQNGRPNVIKALATAPDIDFFIKDLEERTPLHLAAIHNRPMVAGILLDRSPGLLLPRDNWGRTAFLLAA